jgi:hypothetical protein
MSYILHDIPKINNIEIIINHIKNDAIDYNLIFEKIIYGKFSNYPIFLDKFCKYHKFEDFITLLECIFQYTILILYMINHKRIILNITHKSSEILKNCTTFKPDNIPDKTRCITYGNSSLLNDNSSLLNDNSSLLNDNSSLLNDNSSLFDVINIYSDIINLTNYYYGINAINCTSSHKDLTSQNSIFFQGNIIRLFFLNKFSKIFLQEYKSENLWIESYLNNGNVTSINIIQIGRYEFNGNILLTDDAFVLVVNLKINRYDSKYFKNFNVAIKINDIDEYGNCEIDLKKLSLNYSDFQFDLSSDYIILKLDELIKLQIQDLKYTFIEKKY